MIGLLQTPLEQRLFTKQVIRLQAKQPTLNPANKQRVLVFDSGVGGLSVCREIIACKPQLELHYLSDNAAFPYGEKTAEQLISRASTVLLKACQQIKPNIVVIACNTASTVVLPSLREQLSIPIVGVVPAIKTAATMSKTKTFALLATPGTVERNYTQQLIDEHASKCRVIRVGSSQLVRHIEAYIHGEQLDTAFLQQIIKQLTEQVGGNEIDTVVLGCTHFPLIGEQLKKIRNQWQWVDSGAAIANRVSHLLEQDIASGSESESKNEKEKENVKRNEDINKNKASHFLWLTQASDKQTTLDHYLINDGFEPSRVLSLK